MTRHGVSRGYSEDVLNKETKGPTVLSRAVTAELRAEMGVVRTSANQLARELGVSQTWLSKRLRDEGVFTIAEVEAIVAALGIEMPAAEWITYAEMRHADRIKAEDEAARAAEVSTASSNP